MTQSSEISTTPVLAPSPIGRLMANRSLRDSTLLIVLAGIWIFFYFATNGTFLTQRNLILLALQTAIVALAAISAVMLIVTRNFDLSVGSAVALIGVIVAVLTVKYDVDPALAVLVCLVAGLLMGAWQGWWVTRMKVSSFIVTLAGMLYFRGISMIATNGATVAPLPPSLKQVATGFLEPAPSIVLIIAALCVFAALRTRELRRGVSLGVVKNPNAELTRALLPATVAAAAAIWLASSKGIPYLIVLVAVCAISADILMRRTRFGAQLYAIGGNPEAARLSGINVDRVIFINFVIAGLPPYGDDLLGTFTMGDAAFASISPCERCVMVNIEPGSAKKGRQPLKTLSTYRRQGNNITFGQNLIAIREGLVREMDQILMH